MMRRLSASMAALAIAAGGGVDTTALFVGDYSNGNDAIILKGEGAVAGLGGLAGKPVNLVELSVSHYLLARALDDVGLSERDLGAVINTSDADMIAAFQTADVEAVVTWNPLVFSILEDPGANRVFDSADIPGEIIDLLVVNTEVLEAKPEFGHALVGAWYEAMSLMAAGDEAALTAMAEASGTDLTGYQAQLASTPNVLDARGAGGLCRELGSEGDHGFGGQVLFDKGILGEGAPSPDFVGVAYPDGTVTGDPNNVRFRFDSRFVRMAADGL